jgi:hypothetical protein
MKYMIFCPEINGARKSKTTENKEQISGNTLL